MELIFTIDPFAATTNGENTYIIESTPHALMSNIFHAIAISV